MVMKGLGKGGKTLQSMWWRVLAGILLAGFIQNLLPKALIAEWIGPVSGMAGIFIGAFVGMIMVASLGRWRAALLPPKWLVIVLFGFLAIWAFDGFNSYVYLILQRPLFYQPQNILRVSSGLLQGLALIFLFLPYFNRSFWAEPLQVPVIRGLKELALALLLGLVVVLAVNSRWPLLFYPLAFISTGMTFFFLSMVGTLFVLLILRQENTNNSMRDFFTLFIPGMAFAMVILLGVNLMRFFAESRLGMVMPPG